MLSPILYALFGILVGMIINRAADNLPPPARRSLFATPHCPYCDSPRTLLEQSGILSFLLRRDKCHNCAAPLSLRAPLVEIATAVLFFYLATRYSFGLYLVIVSFFTAILLLIAVIDIEHKLILNVVVLPATVLAILANLLLVGTLDNWQPIVLGAAVGYGATLAFYFLGILFLRIINRNRRNKINTVAFGMGDVKLSGLLGALVGFPAIIYVLVYGVLLGGVGAVLAILLRIIRRRGYSAFMAIPYGPFLVIAGFAFLIWQAEIFGWLYGQ